MEGLVFNFWQLAQGEYSLLVSGVEKNLEARALGAQNVERHFFGCYRGEGSKGCIRCGGLTEDIP